MATTADARTGESSESHQGTQRIISRRDAAELLQANPSHYVVIRAKPHATSPTGEGVLLVNADGNDKISQKSLDMSIALSVRLAPYLKSLGPKGTERFYVSLDDLLKQEAAIAAHQRFLAKLPFTVSPSKAAALQATEIEIRAVGAEFGFLNNATLAEILGAKGAPRSFAAKLRETRRVLSIRHVNKYVYPGFQIDARHGTIKPVFEPLAALRKKNGKNPVDVVLWVCSPSKYLPGGVRPVDVLDDADRVLSAADNEWNVNW